MKPFTIPVVALGPGSQAEADNAQYLELPHDMRTYRAPVLPESEETRRLAAARAVLAAIASALAAWRPGSDCVRIGLDGLDPANRKLIDQVLGEGEVSARVEGEAMTTQIQESVFAGVWRVWQLVADGEVLADAVEVGYVPHELYPAAAVPGRIARPEAGPGVASAPALLAEIEAQLQGEQAQHVINLTLLPFTPEDGAYLDQALGRGRASMLSRGYGNCRITATAVPRVWWVQYFNAQDTLILNTLEITDVPEVARAAAEDLADSRERLVEVLHWLGETA